MSNPHAAAFIHILQAARILIDRRQEEFICHALDGVGQLHPDLYELCEALGDYVQSAIWYGWSGKIRRCYTFDQWLLSQLPGYKDLDEREYGRLSHLARLAWIDKMIDNLTTTGNLP